MEQQVKITQEHQCSPYLIINSTVENKIKYLCSKIPDIEWSGILFYKTLGTYEEGLKVICTDIFLMDIGSSTYTEFNTSPDIAHYIAMNDLFECEQALIHSHNRMATCPSGTDINTLKEEGNERIHFVSLIVNNAGTYSAFITRKCVSNKIIKETIKYKTFNGKEVSKDKEYTEESINIKYSKMEIIKEDIDYSEIDARIAQIEEEKKQRELKRQEELKKQEKLMRQPDWVNNSFYYSKTFMPESPYSETDKSINNKFATADYSEFPKNIHIDNKQVQTILRQIITGSILSANNTNLNLYEWVPKMEAIYDKRFKDLEIFNMWIDSLLEVLFSEYTDGEGLFKIDEGRDLANALYQELSKYTPNKYIKIILNSLLLWME